MIDFDNEKRDALTTEEGWAVLLNKKHLKVAEGQEDSLEGLIKDFSKLYVEKKKKRPHTDSRFPDYDINAFWAFADSLEKKIKTSFEKKAIRVYNHPRAKYFGNNYMLALEVHGKQHIPKLEKIVKDFGKLVPLEEAYDVYFEIYNKRFHKEKKE